MSIVGDIHMTPIGYVRTEEKEIPKYWTISDVEGRLVIDDTYREGLQSIKKNQRIDVVFYFHESTSFDPPRHLAQHPRGNARSEKRGVFSTRSPIRPNPIGVSTVTVTGVEGAVVHVKGLDMVDGTPILDIKPCKGDRCA